MLFRSLASDLGVVAIRKGENKVVNAVPGSSELASVPERSCSLGVLAGLLDVGLSDRVRVKSAEKNVEANASGVQGL